MKRHLNTLFVTTQGTYLSKEGECVCVNHDGRVLAKIPVHTLGGITCFGNVGCSPFLMGHCAENDVHMSFYTEYGRFLASVQGPVSGNVLLRRDQYRAADDPGKAAALARAFIIGKVFNSRAMLRRAHRSGTGDPRLETAAAALTECLRQLERPLSLDEARGVEGHAGAIYFGAFDAMIGADKVDFRLHQRSRRPPLDPINALLSFFYTLLMSDIRSALEGVGLDPQVGFLHRDRSGRASLALDMMEEFRAPVADRLVFAMVNRGQISKKDFETRETGAVILKDDARKRVLAAWQDRKQVEIVHPFLDEKMTVGLLWHTQARLLARSIREGTGDYPPFAMR